MESLAHPSGNRRPLQLIASAGHTAAFIAVVLVMAIGGAVFQHGGSATAAAAPQRSSAIPVYLSALALECALAWFVIWSVRPTGTTLRELVGGRWDTIGDVVKDVVLGGLAWGAWISIAAAWHRLSPEGAARSIDPMLPRGIVEGALWIAVSMSAGFAEELAFRGYLQRQCAALTGSLILGVIIQASVFGIAHGYQGVDACLRIAAYGVLFGLLAAWRGSLRAGMIAHAWTDIAAGLLRI
ncbi:MAG: CPBP family intramembrane glutamic endopeptidase [bacterium]